MSVINFSDRRLIWNSEQDISDLINEINKTPNLEELNISGNVINIEPAESLAQALESQKNLKRLFLNDIFTGRNYEIISACLTKILDACAESGAQIEVLNLSDNALGHRGICLLTNFLSKNLKLRELYLNNLGLGIEGAKSFYFVFHDWINNLKNNNVSCDLSVFCVGRNRLEDEGAENICSPLKHVNSLKKFLIFQNGIRVGGVPHIVDVLKANPGLEEINFNDNLFVEEGAELLANVLPSMTSLKILDLGDCLIRNKGAGFVFESLKGKKLKKLDIGFNELSGNLGHLALDLVEKMEGFESLCLDGNEFGDQEVEKLKERAKTKEFENISVSISEDEGINSDVEEDDDLIAAIEKTKI